MENQISSDTAVRRELQDVELMQIWTIDRKNRELAKAQRTRMKAEFGTEAIPLHVLVHPDTGKEIARFEYPGGFPDMDEYIEFVKKGKAAVR